MLNLEHERIMEIAVGMGELAVAESPHTLMASGLGSCVAVILYDEYSKIGGAAHIMLPYIEEALDQSNPAKFADVAICMLVDEMEKKGARIDCLTAKIFGGANMFPQTIYPDSAMDVGCRNIAAVKEELEWFGIEIVAEDTSHHVSRTVQLDTNDGSVLVRTAYTTGEYLTDKYSSEEFYC